MVQSGLSGTRIANNWRATGPFELTSLQAPWRYLAPWKLPSMLTYDRLNRQLPVWGVDFDAIHASPIEGTYNVYNFTAKRFETHEGPELTPELFKACFALPVWFPPVEIGGKTYIDGVYWKDANLTEAVRRGADEIWVIWTVAETRAVPAQRVRPVLRDHRGDRRRPVLRGAGGDRGHQRGRPGRHRHRAPRDHGPRRSGTRRRCRSTTCCSSRPAT